MIISTADDQERGMLRGGTTYRGTARGYRMHFAKRLRDPTNQGYFVGEAEGLRFDDPRGIPSMGLPPISWLNTGIHPCARPYIVHIAPPSELESARRRPTLHLADR